MNKRGLVTRIVAIVLAAVMLLGVAAAAVSVLAASAGEVAPTGQELDTGKTAWLITAAVAAIIVIAVCIVLPMLKKKK